MRKLELVIYFFHCLYLMLWLVATLLFFLLLLAQKFFPLVTNRDQMNWPGAIFLDSIYLVFPFESHHRFNPRLYFIPRLLQLFLRLNSRRFVVLIIPFRILFFFSLLSNISVFNEEPQLVDRSLDGVLTKKSIFGTWTPTTDFFSTFEKL